MDQYNRSNKITALSKHRQRGFSVQKLIAASGAIVISFLLVVVGVQWLQQYRLRVELTEQLALIEALENRNEDAGEEVERLHDLDYIELLARKHLGLVKPGETVFLIKD